MREPLTKGISSSGTSKKLKPCTKQPPCKTEADDSRAETDTYKTKKQPNVF